MDCSLLDEKLLLFSFTTCCVLLLVYVGKLLLPQLAERREGLKLKKKIDGPDPHWLFGHLNLLKPNQETMDEVCKRCKDFPKIGQVWFGPFLSYVMVHHPHVMKPILTISEQKDTMAYRFIKPWIGDGLLVSSGKKWHRNRHLLTGAFHFKVLQKYTEIFKSCSDTLLNKLECAPADRAVEIYHHVSLMTLDSMLQCAISCATDCQTFSFQNEIKTPEHKYISAVYDLTTLAMKRIFNPLYHNDFIYSLTPSGRKFKASCDFIHSYDEKVINHRKRNMMEVLHTNGRFPKSWQSLTAEDIDYVTNQKNKKYLDFLDTLLLTRDADGCGLTDREVRDEVDTFLFEGHDTTASGISWAFYCLADNPDYQEKCRAEVRGVLNKRFDVTWDDLSRFPYLTMFIKEVLRLYPPVFAIARTTSKPVTFERGFGDDQHCLDDRPSNSGTCGITLGKSTNIGIPLIVLHRNETVWKDPTVFDPSRFDRDAAAAKSPYAYLPFSAGPRNCIGQNFAMAEMKVVLAKALQRFQFFLDDQCPKPEIFPMIVLKSTNGIHVRIKQIT